MHVSVVRRIDCVDPYYDFHHGLLAVFDFIEGWYNTQRRHSSLAYESPMNFEQLAAQAPVEGDEAVDALRAPTSFLENAPRAFPTPPTGSSQSSEVIT